MLFDVKPNRDFIALSREGSKLPPSNSSRWRLILIHSHNDKGTKFYYFKNNLEIDFKNPYFIPRNLFGEYLFDFVNLGGVDFEVENFRYPVLVNEADGCIDAHVKPSYLGFFIPNKLPNKGKKAPG